MLAINGLLNRFDDFVTGWWTKFDKRLTLRGGLIALSIEAAIVVIALGVQLSHG